MKTSKLKGHTIIYKDNKWRYKDTMTPTAGNERSCRHCGKSDTKEGYDGCIGTLPNVMSACCGHGETGEAYIQYLDGNTIHGKAATCKILKPMKALFLPLKTEYYEAYVDGRKTEELRLYGSRWNENTCTKGREIILSKGYGKYARMKGKIWNFKKQHGRLFGAAYKADIKKVYGTLDVEIACISINELKPQTLEAT